MGQIEPINPTPNSQPTHFQEFEKNMSGGDIWSTLSIKKAIDLIIDQIKDDEKRQKEASDELKKSETGLN